MSTANRQHRRPGAPNQPGQQQEEQQQTQELETLEEGQEITASQAERLSPQMGNQAVQDLINNQAVSSLELEGQEEEQIEEVIEVEESDFDQELDVPGFGGGGGAGIPGGSDGATGGGGATPWGVGKLFGGEDDEDSQPTSTGRGRLGPSVRRDLSVDDELDEPFEDDPDALDDETLAPIIMEIDRVPLPPARARRRDEVYAAVESALDTALRLGRRSMAPEMLLDAVATTDPLGRPYEIAAFLARHGDSPRARSLGRAAPSAVALSAPSGSYATAVCRAATLAVCAEAHEGGRKSTDQAVQLALELDAWPQAVAAARPLASQGRLRSPQIAQHLLRCPVSPGVAPPPELGPSLGSRALHDVLPTPYLPEVPELILTPPDHLSGDDVINEIDALIAQLTGGADPRAPSPVVVQAERLQPTLRAARFLMNGLGKAHVELAAAALALRTVAPDADPGPALHQADNHLTQITRRVLRAGRAIERMVGQPIPLAQAAAPAAVAQLSAAREDLIRLRTRALEALASELGP